MLATWFRMKYPHLMDGAIAGSGGACCSQPASQPGTCRTSCSWLSPLPFPKLPQPPHTISRWPCHLCAAPIWTYEGERPPQDSGIFAKIVTQDASLEGGSAEACADNVRQSWATLLQLGRTGGWGCCPAACLLLPPHLCACHCQLTSCQPWALTGTTAACLLACLPACLQRRGGRSLGRPCGCVQTLRWKTKMM